MRLCIVSHAYREVGYYPILASMAAHPGVELAWITPDRYMVGVETHSGTVAAGDTSYQVFALPIRMAGRQGTMHYDPAALNRALDAFRPDILLHEQEVFAIGAGQLALVARQRGLPLVLFVWENLPRTLAWPRRLLMKFVLRNLAGLITGSEQSAQVHRTFGFTGALAVIPQMGPTLNDDPSFGRRDPAALQVCFAGRLVASKGVDVLLRALAELKQHNVPVQGTIAGRGELVDELKQLAATLGIASQVTFTGAIPLPEVAAMLRRSDVLVLPSRRTPTWEEQFGRILTEAMAEATVTVGARTGAIPEVIGLDSLLFAEDDSHQLAAILERLATDPAFLVSVQHTLWQRARDLFQMDVLRDRRIGFLAQVLDAWRAAHPAAHRNGKG